MTKPVGLDMLLKIVVDKNGSLQLVPYNLSNDYF